MPVNKGRAPNAERIYPDLGKQLDQISDQIERQIFLLSWFFEVYAKALPDSHIIRYEALIETGGKCLEIIAPRAVSLEQDLSSRNTNAVYSRATMEKVAARLLAFDGAFWNYYSKQSVIDLLEDYLKRAGE